MEVFFFLLILFLAFLILKISGYDAKYSAVLGFATALCGVLGWMQMPLIVVFFLLAFIFLIITIIKFIEDQNINEDDPNLSYGQKAKICVRYQRSLNPKQKEYLKFIHKDTPWKNVPGVSFDHIKQLREYFKQCDIEGNGNYFKGVINKKTGTRYQLRLKAGYKLYKEYLKNRDKFDK